MGDRLDPTLVDSRGQAYEEGGHRPGLVTSPGHRTGQCWADRTGAEWEQGGQWEGPLGGLCFDDTGVLGTKEQVCVVLNPLTLASEAGDTSPLGKARVNRGLRKKARVESGFSYYLIDR